MATRWESFEASGAEALKRIRMLVHEVGVRRILIKKPCGEKVAELPLGVGVGALVLLPIWTMLGSILAKAARYRIEVERNS